MEKLDVAHYRKLMFVESKKIILDHETLYRMDLCILYSSKLDDFRQNFESWFSLFEVDPDAYIEPGTGEKFEKLFDLLQRMKKFPPKADAIPAETLVLRSGITTIFKTFQLVHELNSRAAMRYDINVSSNEMKLTQIWTSLRPDTPLKSRFTKQWQEIGFQGNDPATDFRAMGLLALDNLHYFCTVYNETALRILKASHHAQSWFLFAVVGINLTAYCLRLARTRQLQYTFYRYGVLKNTFNEVYGIG
jgi:hypothetical protein